MAKPTRLTLVLVAASLALAAAATFAKISTRSMTMGADFGVVCAASVVITSGSDPYDPSNLGAVWPERLIPLTYPPLLVQGLSTVCGRLPFWVLVFGAAALMIAISLRVPGIDSVALTTTAVLSGFGAFPWLVLTGNLAMIEGVMGAVAALGLVAGHPRLFGAALGLAGFVKIAPLLLLAAAWVRWPAGQAWRAIGVGISLFTVLQVVSYLAEPVATLGYWHALTDGFGGHVARELRLGGAPSPSHFSFLPIVGAHLGAGREVGLAAAALLTVAAAAAWLRLWAISPRDERTRLSLAAGLMLLIAVGYPRFKPYTLFLLTPLLALALCNLAPRRKNVATVLTCLLPCLALLGAALAPDSIPLPAAFVLAYAQWLLTAAVVVVLLSRRGLNLLAAKS
jgi:hypothetical protein